MNIDIKHDTAPGYDYPTVKWHNVVKPTTRRDAAKARAKRIAAKRREINS